MNKSHYKALCLFVFFVHSSFDDERPEVPMLFRDVPSLLIIFVLTMPQPLRKGMVSQQCSVAANSVRLWCQGSCGSVQDVLPLCFLRVFFLIVNQIRLTDGSSLYLIPCFNSKAQFCVLTSVSCTLLWQQTSVSLCCLFVSPTKSPFRLHFPPDTTC